MGEQETSSVIKQLTLALENKIWEIFDDDFTLDSEQDLTVLEPTDSIVTDIHIPHRKFSKPVYYSFSHNERVCIVRVDADYSETTYQETARHWQYETFLQLRTLYTNAYQRLKK